MEITRQETVIARIRAAIALLETLVILASGVIVV